MSEKFFVRNDYILVDIPTKDERRTEGGIIVPLTKEEKVKRAVILQMTDDVAATINAEVGDTVLIYSASGLKCEEFGYAIQASNIYGIIKKEVDNVVN
jgi:co-chaperonin GroES (HSP10)